MSLEGAWEGWLKGWRATRRLGVSIIEPMVIDMNEAQVRTVEQVQQVLEGTRALDFRAAVDDAALWQLDNRVLRRTDRGAMLVYALSGYSRAQVPQAARRADQDALRQGGGDRHAPAPEGRPGFIRIDSVHQGANDGIKGLHHINPVDCVT